MNAFVAGSTGYTGRAVVAELADRGIATTAHIRPGSPRLEEWRARFTALGAAVDTTAWSAEAMAATLARQAPDLVFALLGTTRARSRRAERTGMAPETYDSVDYGLTSLLIDAVRSAAPRARLIYLSSLGVRDGTRNPYLAARARVDRKLRESGLSFVIARPSFITGPDRDESRPGERIGAFVADRVLGLAALLGGGALRARFGSTTNRELARALVRLALESGRESLVAEAKRLRDPH